MCSGCSGEYSGGFEDFGELGPDWGDGDRQGWASGWASGEPEGENWPVAERESSFEAHSDREWNWQAARQPAARGESAVEICEILVSATRIVEIRVVRANSEEIKGFLDTEATETGTIQQRSRAESAKYYQTSRGGAEGAGDRVQVPCCSAVLRGFKTWRRWARKVLQGRAKKF